MAPNLSPSVRRDAPDTAVAAAAGLRPAAAGPPRPAVVLDAATLDQAMPLHLWIDRAGRIISAGPTLVRITGHPLTDRLLLDVFTVRRPGHVETMAALAARTGARVTLVQRDMPPGQERLDLRGVLLALGDGNGWLLDLSLGMQVIPAVQRHGLTATDFAPSDLTMELLYLVEAKAAVEEELRALNLRLHGAKQEAEQQALTDTLTGVGNRRMLDAAMAAAMAGPHPFALMTVDLDRFKGINDTLGHAAGDHVLCEVARILREESRGGGDVVARIGGDEFALLFMGVGDAAVLGRLAERILARLHEPILWKDRSCNVSISIGATLSSAYSRPTAEGLLADADQALYASKGGGRARATIFGAPAG